MLVLGIMGGVASGKSLVARQLHELGAAILDADGTGHLVLREPEVVEALINRWGTGILGPDGQVDRAQIAKLVFAPGPAAAAELAFLERITHPRIGERLQTQIDRLRCEGRVPAVVLDAPVMVKAGWHHHCDWILFVAADEATRLRRAGARGWSESQFRAREAAQESLAEKRRFAHVVIDNSGTPAQTMEQVIQFWQSAGLALPDPPRPAASAQVPY